ncbi:MAG TPA: histidine kinase N-terminal domain-containing protein [Acidimicrobiales bacterium]|nr:histidine kinase N-terminal domain-containing protein [Acidimicrobiales bacterium]
MITPAEIAAEYADLDHGALAHLKRLLGAWGVLSDLSFSDLLLLTPVKGSKGSRFVVLGQMRPSTSATILGADLVGQFVLDSEWPMVGNALQTGRTISGVAQLLTATSVTAGRSQPSGAVMVDTGEVPTVPEEAQIECVPVPFQHWPAAVIVRVSALDDRRRTGRLERIYRDLYHRLATMVEAGDFPFAGEDFSGEDAPRVGDGLMVIDSEGRISYSSPNAMSALHRMGVNASPDGKRLVELGVEETAVERALATGKPVIEEVERRPDVAVLVHCTPLLASGIVTGAMVLLRDVTDLRRLDRLLLSKDAAIREVHHRVKNNLQTISSLLSLQARRLEPGKGREALRESERRVRSISLVHEILSREPGDEVPFRDIVRSLVRMAEDSVLSRRELQIRVSGDLGEVAAEVATPLAVVLAEVLQNAVEHAFASESDDDGCDGPIGNVAVLLDNDGKRLRVEVRDDGRGLPPGFDIERTTSLGLSIVRDLVKSQLDGEIAMESDGGTSVVIDVPITQMTVSHFMQG